MLNCVTVLPEIAKFIKFNGGMKSGWVATALDNSILHKLIVDSWIKEEGLTGKLFCYVYGDDVWFYSKISECPMSPELFGRLKQWYEKLNIVMKEIPTDFSL